jgi:hypothetical protein
MNLKHRYANRVWEDACTEDLARNYLSNDDPTRDIADIVARMLDAMPLTDQQKLDIIDPCSVWEIVKEPK